MLATLDASLDRARSRRQAHSQQTKAYSSGPFDVFAGSSGYADTQETAEAQNQFEHYRGTFWSACRIVIHRFAQQGVMLARRTRRPTPGSIQNQMRNGFLPQGSVPTWITGVDRLEIQDVHPLLAAMHDPNEEQSPFNMREMLAGSLMATGRGYLVALNSNREGRTFDLWPVPATWMHRDKARKQYRIKPPNDMGEGIPVDPANVASCHFADPENPACVISPMAMLARSVLVDESIQGAQHSEFKNPMPKVALIAGDLQSDMPFSDDPNRVSAARPVRLEPHQRRQIVTWFQQQFAGVSKYGLPMVLDAIIRDIKILSRKPDEMAFQESAALTKEQIFGGIGISELLTGKLEGISRASGALAEQFAVDYCLNPIITLVSQAITKKLCPLFALDGEQLVCWVCPVVPRDVELTVEMLKLGRLTYSIRRNEFRAIISQHLGIRLPWVEGFDDVVMPQTLDERDEETPTLGIGRMDQPVPPAPENGKSRLLLPSTNGRH